MYYTSVNSVTKIKSSIKSDGAILPHSKDLRQADANIPNFRFRASVIRFSAIYVTHPLFFFFIKIPLPIHLSISHPLFYCNLHVSASNRATVIPDSTSIKLMRGQLRETDLHIQGL